MAATRPGISSKIIMALCVLIVSIAVTSAKEKTNKTEKSTPFLRVYQMGKNADGAMSDFITPLTYEELVEWSKIRHIKVNKDKPPVKDNVAWFTSKYGSQLHITGLHMHKDYYLWIDFVTFASPEDAGIPAILEISADGKKLKRIRFNDLSAAGQLVRMKIPRETTVDGEVKILFVEYSGAGGFFGIWDMVVTDTIDMPSRVEKEQKKIEKEKPRLKEKKMELLKPGKKGSVNDKKLNIAG